MDYKLFPPVKDVKYSKELCCFIELGQAKCSCGEGAQLAQNINGIPKQLIPTAFGENGFEYFLGEKAEVQKAEMPQSYVICITPKGITLNAHDILGLRYGLDTLGQIIENAENGCISCLTIYDYPSVLNRGLMLDVSRGKVYTRDYLLKLADLLGKLRYNVMQLYIEHTFDFEKHPEICDGSGPVTAQDIIELQKRCKKNGVELQANLQSLGHFRRILTRPQHQALAESDMFWSLCTTSDAALKLLEDLYDEYLPLFESEWLNVCMDEPYDIGKGQSSEKGIKKDELYANFLLNVHKLAAKHGKKIMAFGDFVCRHPEFISKLPKDIVYLDWCYDPKEEYKTPQLFSSHNAAFWVSPGSGNWNTLFPRFDGAVTNVNNLITEGISFGAEGMLFTDWNDHGGYTQPGPGYYMYAYAGLVSWSGSAQSEQTADEYADKALQLPGYAKAVRTMAQIYQLPPIWSKNRSECVMALFDEPIFGKAVRAPVPPNTLKAYCLDLPNGVEPVFERHSQHPLRPYFSIPEQTCEKIMQICTKAEAAVESLKEGSIKNQMLYIIKAFVLMADKLALSRRIIDCFNNKNVDTVVLLSLEDSVAACIKRFTHLQLEYIKVWCEIAKISEIEISLVYFANIISRLYYLRDWLSIQREKISKGGEPDYSFDTYNDAQYQTLPTY